MLTLLAIVILAVGGSGALVWLCAAVVLAAVDDYRDSCDQLRLYGPYGVPAATILARLHHTPAPGGSPTHRLGRAPGAAAQAARWTHDTMPLPRITEDLLAVAR